MRIVSSLTKVFAFAALVLLGHPDTASAQLTFTGASITNNTLSVTISGPGASATVPVTVSTAAGQANTLNPPTINTTDGTNWLGLTGFNGNGATFSVYIDPRFTANLAPNGHYTGTVTLTANA